MKVVAFPLDRVRRYPHKNAEPAVVIILPVVRIERFPDEPVTKGRRRRRSSR